MSRKRFDRAGVIAALIHLLLFAIFYFYINALYAGKAQAQLIWIYWLIIDFPVSILLLPTIVSGNIDIFFLCFFHGILGTLWWYYMPRILLILAKKIISIVVKGNQ